MTEKSHSGVQSKSTNAVTKESVDQLQILHICSVQQESKKFKLWYVRLQLGSKYVKFKFDTGAECNTLTEDDYKKLSPQPQLLPAKVALKPYMSERLIYPIGKIKVSAFEYYVVSAWDRVDNLLSLDSCEELGLIKRTDKLSVIPDHEDLFTCSLYSSEAESNTETDGDFRCY